MICSNCGTQVDVPNPHCVSTATGLCWSCNGGRFDPLVGVLTKTKVRAPPPSGTAGDTAGEPHWRVGTKLGRTLYHNGVFVGVMDSPELAAQAVEALNGSDAARAQLRLAEAVIAALRTVKGLPSIVTDALIDYDAAREQSK